MISIKRGDSFVLYADIKNEQGQPLITDTINIKSQIRDTEYQLICDLTITKSQTPGRYLFSTPSTDEWPVYTWGANKLLMDIELRESGLISSSDTIEIAVIKDVTRGE